MPFQGEFFLDFGGSFCLVPWAVTLLSIGLASGVLTAESPNDNFFRVGLDGGIVCSNGGIVASGLQEL